MKKILYSIFGFCLLIVFAAFIGSDFFNLENRENILTTSNLKSYTLNSTPSYKEKSIVKIEKIESVFASADTQPHIPVKNQSPPGQLE